MNNFVMRGRIPVDMSRLLLSSALLPLALLAAAPAEAIDYTWSGFGTIGYAQSDQNFNYQRFINNDGTIKRDSVLGGQLDLRFSQQFGATIQAKLAPSDRYDHRWHPALTWAFVSWRPSDDWLIRVGKLRLPLMLNTENVDVGATFDFARLPHEVYSISPMNDVVGLSLSKTWFGDSYDWIIEAYAGTADAYLRYYGRERTFDQRSPGAWYLPMDVKSSGLVATARSIDHTFRVGIHEVEAVRPGAKTGAQIVFQPIAPGVGVYNLDAVGVDKLNFPVYTLSASFLLPADIRLTSEYAKMRVHTASAGLSRWGAYAALSKRIGAWVPYISYAKMKSTDFSLEQYRAINANRLPPPYAGLNSSQVLLADIISPFDQTTTAVGTSYRLTPASLVKAEWSVVRTGDVSSLVDAPRGEDSAHRRINIFSISYNFTF